MGIKQGRKGLFFVGLYTWITAMFVGAILVDMIYARLIPNAAGAFSEVADVLLFIGFVTFLAGLAAIAFSWKSKFARALLIASLLALTFEFVVPLFFSLLFPQDQMNDFGPWLRFLPVGMASILAFLGLVNFLHM